LPPQGGVWGGTLGPFGSLVNKERLVAVVKDISKGVITNLDPAFLSVKSIPLLIEAVEP